MELGKLLLFTLFSSIEYVGMFLLMFSLFRVNSRWYIPHILFVCISLSYFSFTMRADSLTMYAPIIQIILLVIFMWLLFRFQIFYAALMSITGYISILVIDVLVASVVSRFADVTIPFTIQMYIIAVISGFLAMSISYLIRKRNWGFVFVPHSEDVTVNYRKRENILMIVVMVLSAVGFAIAFYLTVILKTAISFYATLLFLLLAVSILLYISRSIDRSEV